MSRNCPICEYPKKELMTNLCANMKIMGPTFPETPSQIVMCRKCGCVYVDMEATQEDFNGYYTSESAQSLSYYEVYGKESTDVYFNDILNKFKYKINYDSQILDIAGGLGDFGVFLKEKGYKNVTVLDVNKKCVEKCSERGLDTILSDTEQFDKPLEGRFDLAVSIHSLEHYFDIKTAMESTKKLVKEGGYIYIEVPNAMKYTEVGSVPYTMYTYEHTLHLTHHTMKNIASAFGIKLLDVGQFFKAGSYYVLYGFYQNCETENNVEFSTETKDAVLKYDKHSAEKLKPAIKKFEKSQEPLILWGIGASTALLLNESFNKCNVISLIDRNPARQGIQYNIAGCELTIQDPDTIKDENATIVVLPYWYKDSIIKQIKEMGFKNKTMSLSNS